MAIVATEIAWREAGTADVDALCALVNQCYRPPAGWEGWLHQAEYFRGDFADADALRAFLNRGTIIIAHRGKQILGAVALHFDDNNALIDWLAVPAPCQSLGLGRFLLYRAEVLARAGMARTLQLPVLQPQLDAVNCLVQRGFSLQDKTLDAALWPWAGEMIAPVAVRVLEKPLNTLSTLFDGPRAW